MSEWISVKERPIPDEGIYLAGLFANGRNGKKIFKFYLLSFERYGIRWVDDCDRYFFEWEKEDFEYWFAPPKQPEDEK